MNILMANNFAGIMRFLRTCSRNKFRSHGFLSAGAEFIPRTTTAPEQGKRRLPALLIILLAFLPGAHAAPAQHTPSIVVSIKPLYSLVAQLTEGITTPSLLLQQSQSPHHYTLKPSQRRLLAQADIIIRTGPILETFLDKIVRQQSTLLIDAWQAPGLELLNKRGRNGHSPDTDADHTHSAEQTDPHIWLSAANAEAISRYLARQLAAYTPEHTSTYNNNLQQLLARIREADHHIRTELKYTQQPFISFHDAFQYFEKAYGLNHVSSISLDEETGSSLKHLQKITTTIRQQQIQCLVYQPPQPALIRSLQQRTGIRAIALDPLGIDSRQPREAWFEIMQQLASGFALCLETDRP